ncbi:DNA gyrase subunit A [compost metagenome]
MIINKSGITIRIGVDELRVMGRATQGVRLIKLNEDDEIASVAKIEDAGEDAEGEETGNATDNANESSSEEKEN